jgi:hypothetical protein
MVQPYMGTKQASFVNDSNAEIPLSQGIYKGLVKGIDTATRSGRLQVYIPEFGGDDPDLPAYWQTVSYASPFLGSTRGRGGPDYPANTFNTTRQTYGFYMSPPDIGSQVLCCFPSGQRKEGYWFACVNPNLSKYMVPAIGSVPANKVDGDSVPPELKPFIKDGQYYPVGEFNEYDPRVFDSDWVNKLRPLHLYRFYQLLEQGLNQDPDRGAISSSIQRDPIGAVFGMSTPGRPTPEQDPANIPDLRQKLQSGDFNPADFTVFNRVGGHSITMDDGDMFGHSNLTRIRSSAGHQIIMNDTKQFMYISNATGTAWVELTAAGDILIYSQKDLSIRSQGNVMMHSDHDFNIEAKGSVNIKSGDSLKLQGQVVQANADRTLNLYGQQTQLKGASSLSLVSGGSATLKGSSVAIVGSPILLNSGGGGGAINPPSKIQEYMLPDTKLGDTGYDIYTNSLSSICYKLPTHEPYIRGSIAAAVAAQEAFAANSGPVNVDGVTSPPPAVTSTAGLDQAATESVTDPAPSGAFIKQPDPSTGLGVLGNDQVRALLAQSGFSDSGSNYSYVAPDGKLGKYSMDAGSLAQLGYVQPGTTDSQLNNPNVWTGKDGMNDATSFIQSNRIQESSQFEITKNNYAQLQNLGVITPATSPDVVAGLLRASQATNTVHVTKWYQSGVNSADNTGTTISQYFNQGRYSQTQVGVINLSNASKNLAV